MSLTELAKIILRNAEVLDEHIRAHSLPVPSTASRGHSPMIQFGTQASTAAAQASMLGAIHKLNHLVQGPAAPWLGTMNGAAGDAMTTAAVIHFDIVDHVPVDEEAAFEAVARKCGMDLRDFKLISRYAMTNFIFREPRPNYIAHTAASLCLRENRVVRALAAMSKDELYPTLASEIDAMANYPGSQEPSESAWAIANGASLPLFEELAVHHPSRATTMAHAMESLASMLPDSITTDHFDWESLDSALIVDVGGGKGFACRALALRFPKLRLIVQDLEATAKAGREQCPAELQERITFTTHDFFSAQPVSADVYYFRAIMHDWPDKYCIQILKALVSALRPGSRVVIQDPHTPDPCTVGWWQERQTRASNLRMKAFFNSHDREKHEWEGLFRQADERYRVKGVDVFLREPSNEFGPLMSSVEAVWEGE
ncbi:uncharacterized protein HMPREF1541_05242 [Cyphellophora europaea CBS 101466]|uniref:O-methyltransferase C-terminal domain-containing protein n=1 Tax=Cyphellophora europaea (strain CBS 101466) TaxID=1220924 RepID=W2RX13_CYPE1|nr:uncharacterized protein HMPREF1541_05242 [Cyphellophora europaea CBS 101466]ETN40962.1 hypothetical protein HMPREF1541_05242 [Cyphellophora europaea CBS 101466]